MANAILEQVKLYLAQAGNGQAEMSDEIIEEFGNTCKALLKSAFSKQEKRKFTIRMSSVGRPLCQQQMEQAGAERGQESYATTMKFLIGDMIEAASVAIMKGANITIEQYQTPLKYEIGGITLDGTLDVVIDGKVYDIKSASPYAFDNKFNSFNAFEKIKEDDAFGYIGQGYLYSEAVGKPFGGWIAINKSTGEWAVAEPPVVDGSFRSAAVSTAANSIRTLTGNGEFKRCYETIPETFNGKSTGKRYLGTTCSYCAFKHSCWKPATLEYAPQAQSKAKNPKRFWYVS
jgi:hypothetical protein